MARRPFPVTDDDRDAPDGARVYLNSKHYPGHYGIEPRDAGWYERQGNRWVPVDMLLEVGYAYSPAEGARVSPGSDHWMLTRDLKIGRAVRRRGDALCKTKDKFWGLDRATDEARQVATCKRCREIARRYGLEHLLASEV